MTPWGPVTPRRWQREALHAVRDSVLSGCRRPLVHACTGAGKARLVGAIAALTPGPVLVTTPTQALTEQLAATIEEHTDEVGRCYQHEWTPGARVVVTCAASLPRLLAERPWWRRWVADEAHLGLPVVPECDDAVGLSATPFTGTRGAALWERVAFTYPSAQAVADGALVDFRAVRWDGEARGLEGQELLDAVCAEWVASAEGPGIVSAASVADAEAYAEQIGALAIHGRMGRTERRDRLEQLRTGAVRALVHCNLLTTGVDLPWLHWLCLRRPVTSPVRLVQEVGRVLRACDGKPYATLYDPHDLLGTIGLTHTAALDAVLAGAPEEAAEAWEIPELEGLGDLATLPAPVAVGRLEGWVEDLLASLRARGPTHGLVVRERPPEENREWRQARATDRQRQALAGLMGRAVGRLPEAYREPFRWLLRRPDLRRGPASDAIDVLSAVMRRWHEVRRDSGHPYWKLPKDLVPEVPAGAEVA